MTARRKQFRCYLESLRAPVAAMCGLPVEAVIIYAQQDLIEHINNAIAACECAVVLGVTNWANQQAEARTAGPPLTVTLDVAVWTPEVILREDVPSTLDIAEDIVHGLHGYSPDGDSPGRALVTTFQRGGLLLEERDGAKWLVASLAFTVPMLLRTQKPPKHPPVMPPPSTGGGYWTADSTVVTADNANFTADAGAPETVSGWTADSVIVTADSTSHTADADA